MRKVEPGHLARSLAGHDKGTLYIILEAAGEYVSLTDGKSRPVHRPKRKKKKHVQLQYPRDYTLKQKLEQKEAVSDEEIQDFLNRQNLQQQGGKESNVEGRRN